MREEPVIYINGRPFVLREDERPFKNLQEYTGIDVRRLEQMELRLKNDILQVCLSHMPLHMPCTAPTLCRKRTSADSTLFCSHLRHETWDPEVGRGGRGVMIAGQTWRLFTLKLSSL